MSNTIYDLFLHQTNENPNHPAVIEENAVYSYQDLLHMASLISDFLESFPEPEQNIPGQAWPCVGLVMDHGAWMIASIFGILKTGAAYVPAEPDFPLERIRFMMEESHVSKVITQKKYAKRLEGLPLVFLEDILAHDPGDNSLNFAAAPVNDGNQPAYILYTSGSTGQPKGVVVRNRNVLHYVRAFQNEFHPGPGDVMLQYSVCSFDIFVEEVFTTLLSGAALFIPTEQTKADLPVLLEACNRHHVTEISGFPYLLQDMNGMQLPKSIRLLISGGDVLRESYVDKLLDQTMIYNTYGPSETTVCASYFRCGKNQSLEDGTFPIGKPVLGTEIKILDNNNHELGVNQPGEIVIFGGGVSAGYLDPAKNQMFTKIDQQPCYFSGDMGCWLPDGNLAFLGRKDEQIMIYGKRVEPKEVESVLCQAPGVKSAVVAARTGDDHLSYMEAWIVSEDPEIFNLDAVVEYMKRYLTPFMIPQEFHIVEQIPLTANGKPDVHRLEDEDEA